MAGNKAGRDIGAERRATKRVEKRGSSSEGEMTKKQKKTESLRRCVNRKSWHVSKNTHKALCQKEIYERIPGSVWHSEHMLVDIHGAFPNMVSAPTMSLPRVCICSSLFIFLSLQRR